MYLRYRPYETVAEKRRKAEKKLKRMRKKNPHMQPVVIEGGSIAKTWWGKAWNLNLEKYADYSNRIGRGRSYVRHGQVLDLKIIKGTIESLVNGSFSRPYKIKINITKLSKSKWDRIRKLSQKKIDSLQELLDGKFPKNLEEVFTSENHGLFPSPKEIKLSCSCPDWATMCKHVAATLYGVGARLDESPELFFTLRGVNMNDLVQFAVDQQKDDLFKSASRRGERRVIEKDDAKLSTLFDIDLEAGDGLSNLKRKRPLSAKGFRKTSVQKKILKKKVLKKKTKGILKRKKKVTQKNAEKTVSGKRVYKKRKK